ncbi:hypothetical protein KZZ52_33255 [Dactylosporangium sp. AC04546]|nr:hypothetical protein [Dactylosporangium sp. AC04546]WVK89679.1 hypothetical protein KZZ52_33255 [Dactylosporangium sp. AC04546]
MLADARERQSRGADVVVGWWSRTAVGRWRRWPGA